MLLPCSAQINQQSSAPQVTQSQQAKSLPGGEIFQDFFAVLYHLCWEEQPRSAGLVNEENGLSVLKQNQ